MAFQGVQVTLVSRVTEVLQACLGQMGHQEAKELKGILEFQEYLDFKVLLDLGDLKVILEGMDYLVQEVIQESLALQLEQRELRRDPLEKQDSMAFQEWMVIQD